MFKTRLLSGILLVILALLTIISGGTVLWVTVALISWIGMRELYKPFHIENALLGICGYLFGILYDGLLLAMGGGYLPVESRDWFLGLIMALVISLMAVMVFSYPKYHADQLMAAFFVVFYVTAVSYTHLTLPTMATV